MGLTANVNTPQRVSASVGSREPAPYTWSGRWLEDRQYQPLEKVSRDGSSYLCVKACAGVDPAADVGEGVEGEYWLLIAKRGRDGRDGTVRFEELTDEQRESLRGDEGPPGPQGPKGGASINGAEALVLKAAEPLKLEQEGDEATLKLEGRVGGSAFFDAVIGTVWTEDGSTGVKSQTIALEGVAAKDNAHVEPRYTGDGTGEGYAAFVEQKQQFLDRITNGYAQTVDGGVVLYIFGEANTVEIPVLVEVK